MKLTDEQITKAVEWWKSAVSGHVKFDNLGSTRGQDAEETRLNEMASMMAGMQAASHEPELHVLDKFGEALSAALREVERGEWFHLDVDYHPDRILAAAAESAELDESRFPWKTHMQFEDGAVRVAHGYGAPYVTLVPPTPNTQSA